MKTNLLAPVDEQTITSSSSTIKIMNFFEFQLLISPKSIVLAIFPEEDHTNKHGFTGFLFHCSYCLVTGTFKGNNQKLKTYPSVCTTIDTIL